MYKLISVGFKLVTPAVLALGCTAENALAVTPCMVYTLKPNISLGIVEPYHRIFAVRICAAIKAAA